MPRPPYRYAAASVGGFVQQLAVSYIRHGYYFYSAAVIPEDKSPEAADDKLIEKYSVDVSKWRRLQNKRNGVANVQYIRFDRFFVLVATEGKHRFFEDEPFRDFRRRPLYFAGYSISAGRGRTDNNLHASVRLSPSQYSVVRSFLLELAPRRSCGDMMRAFGSLSVECYGPVVEQLDGILTAVNKARKRAGLEAVPESCVSRGRRPLRPFG